MAAEAREIAREASAVERNRAAAPTTVAFAEMLFDVAHQYGSDALEDAAVCVDADAQRGQEYTADDVRRIITRVKPLLDEAQREGKE